MEERVPLNPFSPDNDPEHKWRLSVHPSIRMLGSSLAAFGVGSLLGVAQGSKMAGLRFRAEHAHKLPKTTTGWYLYHKTKNYHVAYGGIKEGIKMGCRVSFWTTAMFMIESLFDSSRRTADALNTVMACVSVAGGFSLWNRFPLATTARTTKTALAVGLVYGGLQDIVGALRGRPISYIEFARRQFRRGRGSIEAKTS